MWGIIILFEEHLNLWNLSITTFIGIGIFNRYYMTEGEKKNTPQSFILVRKEVFYIKKLLLEEIFISIEVRWKLKNKDLKLTKLTIRHPCKVSQFFSDMKEKLETVQQSNVVRQLRDFLTDAPSIRET